MRVVWLSGFVLWSLTAFATDEDVPEAQDLFQVIRLAVKSGNIEEVKRLIDNGADLDRQDKRGGTALLAAVYSQQVEMVKLLIESGADSSIADSVGNTALDVANRIRMDEIVAILRAAQAG